MKKIFLISIIAASMILNSSCNKDDAEPGNQTNGKSTAIFNPGLTYGTMTDQDGNIYKTITIGTQTWMAENLRAKTYNDGTEIKNITGKYDWPNLTSGGYCNFNNTTNNDTIATYGMLYNWNAVGSGKLAPKGWHVSTDAEWTTLTDYLGGESVAGSKLKETGIIHWASQNSVATNETGFTALPGGWRYEDGIFHYMGDYSGFWCANEHEIYTTLSWYRLMHKDGINVFRDFMPKKNGYSVRCVKD